MTPRKKPDEEHKPVDVHVTGVDPAVQAKASESLDRRKFNREIILALFLMMQTIAIGYFQTRNTNAVTRGTEEMKVQTKEVAEKLEATGDAHGDKLDEIKKTADETKETSDRTNVIVNSGALINGRMYVAALKRLVAEKNDPDDIEELKKAQQAVTEHEEGQKVLDDRAKTKADP